MRPLIGGKVTGRHGKAPSSCMAAVNASRFAAGHGCIRESGLVRFAATRFVSPCSAKMFAIQQVFGTNDRVTRT